jgi:hypothetical protein
MNRLDAMLERLPPIYSIEAGSLVRKIMEIFAAWMSVYDEDLERVRNSHWIDTAYDRADLEKIGDLFDISPLPWEPDELFRERIKAMVAARLKGAITRDTLEELLLAIIDGAHKALSVRYFDLAPEGRIFHDPPAQSQTDPTFIEFVPVKKRCEALVAKKGLVKSLEKITINNRSLFRTPLQITICGIAGSKTVSPVMVNLTNGNVLAFAGDFPCGRELKVRVDDTETVYGGIGDTDVTAYLHSARNYRPARDFTPMAADSAVKPIMLERGENTLWFFPLGLFDFKSLNAGILGMPSPDIVHGSWGDRTTKNPPGTPFGSSLFEQEFAASLDLFWVEKTPATFTFEVPIGAVLRKPGTAHADFVERQERLFDLLNQTITLLRGAGVSGTVEKRPLRTTQRQDDHVRVWRGEMDPEEQRVESKLRALSGIFDSGTLNNSYFS